MKKQKTIHVFIGIVENENGDILMTKRNESKLPEAHDKWELPGGKVDFGETAEQAIEREFLEETGYSVYVEKLLPTTEMSIWEYPECSQHTIVMCFKCKLKNDKPSKTFDYKISDIKWVRPEEITNLSLLAGTKTFIDTYLKQKLVS